jgi:hypothetical protein
MRRWSICRSTFSLLVRVFRVGRLPLVSLLSGPRLSASSSPSRCLTSVVSPLISTAPLLPAPPTPHLGCRRAITAPPPHHFPFSNRALTHRNKPNYSAIEAPPSPVVTPPSPSRHPSCGPIKATPMTPGAFHTSPSSSLLLSRTGTPPHRASPITTTPPCLPVATSLPELR